MKKYLLISALLALPLSACSNAEKPVEEIVETGIAESTETMETVAADVKTISLADVLAAQPDEVKARYAYRNPEETLGFFGIEPGMTVAEVLPGGGWYSKLLLGYLGENGKLIGVDYDIDMWAKFGGFADDKFLEARKTWSTTWTQDAMGWRDDTGANVSAFAFGAIPKDLKNSVDAVLMIRALHHLNRFEQAHLASALTDIKTVLKPDGIVGIVQHRGAEDQADDWAGGDNGYLKQSYVIQIMDDAGFELVGNPSEINANPKDKATSEAGDKVWRLPPTLGTSADDAELRAKMEAIGETDRMTLKFKLK